MKTIKNLKAEEIRKSILQLAIQGKLVKQDPNDEPASELVKRIYAEKQRLIKEGKIKKDKNESYIFKGDDNCYYEKIGNNEPIKLEDLPFDIPDNWMWIRLGKLCKLISTGIEHYPNKKIYYSTGSIKGDIFTPEGEYEFDKRPSRANRIACLGDIIDAKMQGTLKVQIIDERLANSLLSTGFYVLRNYLINIEYLKYFISSNYYQSEKDSRCSGTTQKAITDIELETIYISLPPINEQNRIVNKIKSCECLLKHYEKIEFRLSTLEEEFPEKLKKSILQYAIEGKLVKQDPNDEPASVLLERIKADKERLINEGKIKRDKNESYIFRGDDKKYYEKVVKKNEILDLHEHTFPIPNSWSWCSLSQISKLITDGTHKTPNYAENGVPFISIANISTGTYDGKPKFISLEEHNSLITRCKPELNDILLCRIGTLGKPYINKLEFDFSIFVSLALVKLIDSTMANYIKIVLDSPNTYSYIDKVKVGGGTHTFKINIEDLSTFPIPLPPKKGQIKIIDKINYLFEKIDNLSY